MWELCPGADERMPDTLFLMCLRHSVSRLGPTILLLINVVLSYLGMSSHGKGRMVL